ncbi:MAG: non-heme iron oxygenase ferredoxin subunit [Candidatus Thiodiazotropha sp.]|jgi:3-phenylpropionate/trans-cinnamate dioxygenase ferredoxin component
MNKNWIVIAQRDEVPDGSMKRVEIDGHRYLVIQSEGQWYAIDDQCSHEDVSLYLGCVRGDHIKCSLHGSRFSLKTGAPLEDPATDPIGTYPIKIHANEVMIGVEK